MGSVPVEPEKDEKRDHDDPSPNAHGPTEQPGGEAHQGELPDLERMGIAHLPSIGPPAGGSVPLILRVRLHGRVLGGPGRI